MISADKIKEIVKSQSVLFEGQGQWLKRETDIGSKLISGYVLVLTGVRRSGKSTLLKQFSESVRPSLYLHFDDPRLVEFEVLDFYKIEEIYGMDSIYLFDELSNIPEWEKYIRHLTERKGKAIVTGSNANLIGPEYGTLLTGRNLPQELFPLSYNEYLSLRNYAKGNDSFQSYIKEGGFPEYLFHPNTEILRQYLIDILNRDIIRRYSVVNTEDLNRLTMYLMNNIARLYSIQNIKKALDVKSVNTLSTYITYLEDVYLLFSVPIYDLSYKRQLINNKKIYAIDTAMVNSVTVKVNQDIGRLFENTIFLHLRRYIREIFYYKKEFECDFVVRCPNQEFQCYQVCYQLNDDNLKRELNGLVEALEFFKLEEGTLISFAQTDYFVINNKKINVISAYEWCTLNPIVNK